MSPLQKAIQDRLERAPKISKRQLAREIGVKPDTLIAWQRGSRPHDYQLAGAAPALGVTVQYLQGASPPPLVPDDVASALKRAAELVPVADRIEELAASAPDLIALLRDAEQCVRRLRL